MRVRLGSTDASQVGEMGQKAKLLNGGLSLLV
jgi:hypothetical protein